MGRGRGGSRTAGRAAAAHKGEKLPKAGARAALKEKTHFLGRSRASVTYHGYTAAEAQTLREQASRILGRTVTDADLATLAGAPHDTRVNISENIFHGGLTMMVSSPAVQATRTLHTDSRGRAVLHNDIIGVTNKKEGLGTKILAREVAAATRLGVHRIETNAARGGPFVGYQVWGKLGYDAKIPGRVKSRLPASLAGAKMVSDLYRTAEGRDFWDAHGVSTDMTFNLARGSQSRKVLGQYIRAKKRLGLL